LAKNWRNALRTAAMNESGGIGDFVRLPRSFVKNKPSITGRPVTVRHGPPDY
jgi:hypothetical protein